MGHSTETGLKLGGGINGYSPQQTVLNYKDGRQAATRMILRRGWNTANATLYGEGGQIMNNITGKTQKPSITPFIAVNNAGDLLSRKNYKCGGPTGMNKCSIGWAGSKIYLGSFIQNCDKSGVNGYSGNPKYVYDSSNYVTYRRQQAINRNYNDLKNGGDDSNASYVNLMAIRR